MSGVDDRRTRRALVHKDVVINGVTNVALLLKVFKIFYNNKTH